MNTLTDQDRKDWAASNLVARAEFGGEVRELNDNGKIYILKRTSPAPRIHTKNISESGELSLIGVIPEPTKGQADKVRRNSQL